MSDDVLLQRVRILEDDNARLRHLLTQGGATAGRRHQMRNTLAMVRYIVRESAESVAGLEDYAGQLEGRLDAVLRIQNNIAGSHVDDIDLDTLVMDEMLVHALGQDARLSVEGPEVRIQPATAGMLGLAIHELATNAIRFGALSTPTGRLAVEWATEAGGDGQVWLTIVWTEAGVGTAVPSPRRRGFGSDLIERGLAYQLGGEGRLGFVPGGLRCTIRLPLPRQARPE